MTGDNDFKPKLGKIRAQASKRGRKYLHQVLRAVAFAGGRASSKRSTFQGNRIGRGAGVGRVLSSRDGYAAFRQRNVVIKSRIVRIKSKGLKPAQVHLRYIQRDGVTREGAPGELYSDTEDRTDGRTFLERAKDDRHQFRFIVSAEDAAEYQDLKPLIRDLMTKMEQDLGTKLDWVAVDHFNTGHPHTHVVLRGQDDRGKDLIIAREYMKHGMRERACEIVSMDLGPRTDLEIENRLRHEVEQERFTSLDRRLLGVADESGVVGVTAGRLSVFQQTLQSGRLQKLKRLGLADEIQPGSWRLSVDLESTLRDMAIKGDIIKTMNRELTEKGLKPITSEYAIYDPRSPTARPITGRVVARGLADEINDRHYLIIQGTDAYSHYVDIGAADATDPMPEGSIVTVRPNEALVRTVDRTVAEIAAKHGGRYSRDIHLRHDPTARVEFVETHIRRLEAIRRATNGAERLPDGTWNIAPDHMERAKAYERSQTVAVPIVLEVLSRTALETQVKADGATWLDGEIVKQSPTPMREAGFGREAKAALDRRRMWLMEQGLIDAENVSHIQRASLIATLRRRELTRVGVQLADELGLNYREAPQSGRIDGTYRKPVNLVSGKFAVIEGHAKDFTLVPWRPVMERNIGKEISGLVRGDRISWSLGRDRGGPTI
jgi:type IV secretory pathway VirD2 relaxase